MKHTFLLLFSLALFFNGFGQSAAVHYRDGRDMLDNKNYTGAIVEFSKAIEIDPEWENIYYFRAEAKASLTDYRGAISDLDMVTEMNPRRAEAYYRKGENTERIQECLECAIRHYSKAIEIDPQNAKYYFRRGNAKLQVDTRNPAYKTSGCLDLSKAGELGFAEAYVSISFLCN
jgi:tetratricopeptide (TPR) repeat protein